MKIAAHWSGNMENTDDLSITVKRRTWFLRMTTPVKIQFNGRLIGTVESFKEKEMESKANIKAGDSILIKDTLFGKTANILLAVWTVIFLSNPIVSALSDPNTEPFIPVTGLVILIIYLVICTVSIFCGNIKL
ncbi:hypothetical protein JEHA107958_01045 [Jeotgalicoccus halotolerans]|uniref:Uncharacterized protein n=2 Tax=Jeotgalicoccus halotolerans TaxID=157227 RepID=A0A3E0B0G0_9STAP|nr:hypothetical protein DFR63_0459 [Jeotgalicoccus halotolerans]